MTRSQETCRINIISPLREEESKKENTMKKKTSLWVFCCILAFSLSFTGCGKSKENSENGLKATITTEPTMAAEPTGAEPAATELTPTGTEITDTEPTGTEQTDAQPTDTQPTTAAEPTSTELTSESDSIKTVYPVTVTGSDGSELTLEKEPEKIISVGPNITEIIYSLEAQQKLVGRTTYCDYPAEAAQIEAIGDLYSQDIEKVVSLEPDLIIASAHFSEDAKQEFEKLKIPIIYLYEEHEIQGVYTMIETLGIALNAKEKAKETIDKMAAVIDEVKNAVENLEPVSVYYVVGFGEYGEFTAGGDTFIQGILTAAGGKNIAQDISGWQYSLESLLEADPEVILVREADYEAFTTTKPYSNLSAVKNGKVYKIDTNMLDRQCARNADAIKEIAMLLHPQAFQ